MKTKEYNYKEKNIPNAKKLHQGNHKYKIWANLVDMRIKMISLTKKRIKNKLKIYLRIMKINNIQYKYQLRKEKIIKEIGKFDNNKYMLLIFYNIF